jgi:hypothetical protein
MKMFSFEDIMIVITELEFGIPWKQNGTWSVNEQLHT